jgi:hypothetical protein
MRIHCEGWKRSQNCHELMNRDISRVLPSNPDQTPYRDEVYIYIHEKEIRIFSGIENFSMGKGNYAVDIRLTREEIINLARIALAKEPFGKVIELLSGKAPQHQPPKK